MYDAFKVGSPPPTAPTRLGVCCSCIWPHQQCCQRLRLSHQPLRIVLRCTRIPDDEMNRNFAESVLPILGPRFGVEV